MPGIFISYRREDSGGYTGRLFDILSAEFGREDTYMDLETIQGGDDFASVIDQKISVSDVLVAVIGDRWLTIKETNGSRRLDNPRDFVRIEIAEALRRGIRVIPVLVAGAATPPAPDLPEDLRPLCGRHAVEIRDSHFHPDAQQLIQMLHSFLPRPVSLDIAGKWTATVKYDWGDTYEETFDFELDGEELSGMAGLLGAARSIREGKITGKRINFTTRTFSMLGSERYVDTHSYKGAVEDGVIRFTMVTDSQASEHTPVHFIAAKV